MIELFKHTNYDFIGKRRYFLAFSLIITLVGIFSVATKGFNLGIDFAGGTMLNIRFKNSVDYARLRDAMAQKGIDVSKVTIQPISGQLGSASKNEVLIRMPQTISSESAESSIDADKKFIVEALNAYYSPVTEVARGSKVDINNSNRAEVKNRLLSSDPLGYKQSLGESRAEQEYSAVAGRVMEYRDNVSGGLISDISAIQLTGLPGDLSAWLQGNFYAGEFNVINVEIVGPQVGKELRARAFYVTLIALLGMLIYIAYRFEWVYGFAAVAAVFHDVFVTLTFFSFFEWEISLNVMASLLSLIGYSMNDTIVIFDRIREKLKLTRSADITKVSNEAINETLSRTVITFLLTFFSALALLLFGGPVLRGFSLALFIGIIVGVYSTVGIATPIMLWGRHLAEKRKAAKDKTG